MKKEVKMRTPVHAHFTMQTHVENFDHQLNNANENSIEKPSYIYVTHSK